MSTDFTDMDVGQQLAFNAAHKEGRRTGRHEACGDMRYELIKYFLCNCGTIGKPKKHDENCPSRQLHELCEAYHKLVVEELGDRTVLNSTKIACAVQANAWVELDEHPWAHYLKRGGLEDLRDEVLRHLPCSCKFEEPGVAAVDRLHDKFCHFGDALATFKKYEKILFSATKVVGTALYERRGEDGVWTIKGGIREGPKKKYPLNMRGMREQIADEIEDCIVEETFGPQDFVPRHVWNGPWIAFHGTTQYLCQLCGTIRCDDNRDASCPDAAAERAVTQLGGCLLAAEGLATEKTPAATKGDYGWSPAYEAVRKLWDEGEGLADSVNKFRKEKLNLEEKLKAQNEAVSIAVEQNQRLLREGKALRERVEAQDEARGQLSAAYHKLRGELRDSEDHGAKYREEIERKTADNDSLRDETVRLRTSLELGVPKIPAHVESTVEADRKLSHLEGCIKNLNGTIDIVTAENARLRKEVESSQKSIATYEDAVVEAESSEKSRDEVLDTLGATIGKLTKENYGLKAAGREDAASHLDKVEEKLKSAENSCINLNRTVDIVTAENARLRREVEANDRGRKLWSTEHVNFERQTTKNFEKVAKLQDELLAKKTEGEAQRKKIGYLHRHAQDYRWSVKKLQTDIDALRRKVTVVQKERSALREEKRKAESVVPWATVEVVCPDCHKSETVKVDESKTKTAHCENCGGPFGKGESRIQCVHCDGVFCEACFEGGGMCAKCSTGVHESGEDRDGEGE